MYIIGYIFLTDSNNTGDGSTLDETYRSVVEKAKELPSLISMDDYRHDDETYTDPNLDSKPTADDDIEMNEDCDAGLDMEQRSDSDDEMEDIMGKFCTRFPSL